MENIISTPDGRIIIWLPEKNFDPSKAPFATHDDLDNLKVQDRIGKLRLKRIFQLKDHEQGFSDGEKMIPEKTAVNIIQHPI